MGAEPLPQVEPPSRRALLLQRGSVRLRDALYTYLPLLLMAVLAGATWWLVRLTPLPPPLRGERLAPTTPDYILQRFELVRYRGDGRLLARIDGQELRHYPSDDRLEVDAIRVRAGDEAAEFVVTARSGTATQEGQQLRLIGDVRLSRRDLSGVQEPVLVETESMELDIPTGQARSGERTRVTQGGLVLVAAGFTYERESRRLSLQGPVRAHSVSAASAR